VRLAPRALINVSFTVICPGGLRWSFTRMLDRPAPTSLCALPIVRDRSVTVKRAVAAMFDENRSGKPRLTAD
jgi:hypothetical protein